VPNIKPTRLVRKEDKKSVEVSHNYYCADIESDEYQDTREYDVRRCPHGIMQVARFQSESYRVLRWYRLEWFVHPILTYRAYRALQETNNDT
jgi:hypothetical protein